MQLKALIILALITQINILIVDIKAYHTLMILFFFLSVVVVPKNWLKKILWGRFLLIVDIRALNLTKIQFVFFNRISRLLINLYTWHGL